MGRLERGAVPWLALLIAAACLAAVLYLLLQDSDGPGPSPGAGGLDATPSEPLAPAGLDDAAVERVASPPDASERVDMSALPAVARDGGPVAGKVSGAVADARGAQLPGARVVLTERMAPVLLMAEDVPALRRYSATTDASGTFVFQTLPSEVDFDMWVYHPEHTPTPGVPVIGLKGEDQDVGTIRLKDGCRVFGMIADTGGNPLPARVEVQLQAAGFRTGTPEQQMDEDRELGRLLAADTDANGRYEVQNLAEGVWTLTASCEGYASVQVHPVVLMGETRQAEQNLELGTEFVIEGVVLDEARVPVTEAMVNAARSRPRPSLNAQARSGADGRFSIRGLPEGMYGLFVTAQGYTPGKQMQVAAGKTDVEVILARKGGVEGRVVDAAGRPVAQCTLAVHRISKGSTSYGYAASRYSSNDPEGNYQITGLDPGPYILLVSAPGFAPTHSPGFEVGREIVRGVDVALQRGGRIFGTVVSSASGEPLPGAELALHGRDYTEESQFGLFGPGLGDPNNVPSQTARADAQGRVEIANAYPGELRVEVRHASHLSEYVPLSVPEGGEVNLGVIQLRPGGAVSGVVLRQDGTPVAGSTVYLSRQSESSFFSLTRTSDARGRFRLQGLRAGNYELSATPPDIGNTLFLGLDDSAQSVYISEGEEATVELRIPEDM
ncbi:MAG: hypothetical protein EYC70_03150 [Planctomycetota bacterium]|nr:MAG: hypothetical protein EYC70_03150 [Planctomycetota bacterium]